MLPQRTTRKLLSTLSPPESIHAVQILMPTFPGQLRYICKNLFHAVYVVDPATSCGLEAMCQDCYISMTVNLQSVDLTISLYGNNFPMRFGLILYSSKFLREIGCGDPSLSAVKCIGQSNEDITSMVFASLSFIFLPLVDKSPVLTQVNRLRVESEDDAPEVHPVEGAFVESTLPKVKSPPQDMLLKLEKEQSFKELAQESSMSVFKLVLFKLQCCLTSSKLCL
ncbi:hypothetical protein Tsubulata_037705 [Turnera subulata]|uniref:UGGT thioredoxin-like domain-containing protein n=1 Tax=Turnera subulata TaxID=218843 RepID=A0A9Q0G8S1_9ROSI|nr:hypothetical protein Tsubulata_037705 [Turnera subulata]